MTDTGRQTAFFFGFVTAAMTYASAQAAQPVHPQPAAAAQAQTAAPATDRTAALARAERKAARPG